MEPASSNNIKHLPESKPAKGIYVLPNLFTTGGLFAGFYAIMQSRIGGFEAACVAIFVAMVMDMLDGRLARLTHTESEFGSQYDSLADVISFGVAPALVIFEWAMIGVGKFGGFAAFLYIACTALRLARFNTQPQSDTRYFTGLPSPAAAAVLASAVWVGIDNGFNPVFCAPYAVALTVFCGASMVSNMPYRSFKDFDVKGRVPFVALIGLVFIVSIVSLDPPIVLFAMSMSYALSGFLAYTWKHLVSSKES